MLEQRKVVTAAPENSETPLENVRSWVTPTRRFFVRHHFHTPRLHLHALPLRKALDPDTLLATRMNGEYLEPIHGFPLRLFVPGWYGVASVKWLGRIEVLDLPFKGYYQTTKYTVQRRTEAGAETVIVGPMAVKSEIIRPQAGTKLGLGMNR